VPARTRTQAQWLPGWLLERPGVARILAGRPLAGPRADDAVRVAGEVVAGGQPVALEHLPAPEDDATAEFTGLLGRVHAAGLAPLCEVTLAVDRLGVPAAEACARSATVAGIGVVLAGPADLVRGLPGTGVVVSAGDPDAEARCRELASGRVRLVQGHGAGADLAFVRCLNVLMAADGYPEVAATDLRLIAIAGERAAWNGRAPDSWEHVMPYGVRTDEQHRLMAAGYTVRVAVASGPGAVLDGRLSALSQRFGARP
jgi:proline dehydrogenase